MGLPRLKISSYVLPQKYDECVHHVLREKVPWDTYLRVVEGLRCQQQPAGLRFLLDMALQDLVRLLPPVFRDLRGNDAAGEVEVGEDEVADVREEELVEKSHCGGGVDVGRKADGRLSVGKS